jgi:DNA-binding transcriptional MerR regulator
MDILGPEEIAHIEKQHAGGLPARAILEIFAPRGVALSEATFRKYVQAGLLPRSRRVGRKGKHRGSQGLYPVEAVRRINAIKKMMAEGMTLEEIRRSFVFFKNSIDQIEQSLDEVLDGFAAELSFRAVGERRRRELEDQLVDLRRRSDDLLKDVARLGSAVTASREQNALEPPQGGAG